MRQPARKGAAGGAAVVAPRSRERRMAGERTLFARRVFGAAAISIRARRDRKPETFDSTPQADDPLDMKRLEALGEAVEIVLEHANDRY